MPREQDVNGEYVRTVPIDGAEAARVAREVLPEYMCDECGTRTYHPPTEQAYVCGTCESGTVIPTHDQ